MKPLKGITLLEFSTMITAALASMMLAEQGARVINVNAISNLERVGFSILQIGLRCQQMTALTHGSALMQSST